MPKVVGSGRKEGAEWTEVIKIDNKRVQCKYCKIGISGKIERIRAHMNKCLVRARDGDVNRRRGYQHDDSDSDECLLQEFASISSHSTEGSTAGSSRSVSVSSMSMGHSSKQQPTMKEFTIKTTEAQKEVLDSKIASFFYACNIPFNAADNNVFLDMVEALRPGYKPPNRKQLGGKLLDEAAKNIESRMKEELKNSTITLVQDGWSSITNDSIIASSLTTGSSVYLVDAIDTGSNKKTSAYCASIAENVIRKIEEQYDKKVFALCTDNENKMIKMREILNQPEKFPKLLTYGCNAHYLNLLEKEVAPTSIVKHIVVVHKYFRNHHQPHAWLKEKGGLMPQLPNDTRWNSQEDCLNTFISNYHKYVEIRMDIEANPDAQIQFDVGVARVLDNVGLHTQAIHLQKQLKAVSVALDKLQADDSTISDAVEVWFDLMESHELEPYRTAISARFNDAMQPFHFLANMMDPRYYGRRLKPDQEKMAEEWVTKHYPEFMAGVLAFSIKDTDVYPSTLFHENVVSKILPSKWWKIVGQKTEKMEMKVINQNKLPNGFCSFFSALHTCPASSASIERLFSTFGMVWSKLRNRLGVEKAQKLVSVYRYLRDKNMCEWDW